jgi:hypothetical protein
MAGAGSVTQHRGSHETRGLRFHYTACLRTDASLEAPRHRKSAFDGRWPGREEKTREAM